MRYFVALFLTFALNLVWEVGQGSLYLGHGDFWRTLPMCAFASLGDVAIVAALFGGFALLARDVDWPRLVDWRGWVLFVVAGAAVAVVVEWWALSTGRWQYATAMPTIPLLRAGLFPVLQMAIIPPIVALWLRRT